MNVLRNQTRIIKGMLLLFVFAIPISSFISAKILIVTIIISIIIGAKLFKIERFLRSSWDICFYLLVLVLGLSYSDDKATGLRLLETSSPLLGLPIFLSILGNLDRKDLNAVFISFALGVFTASMICLVSAGIDYYTSGYDYRVLFFYDFTDAIDSHPTYLAYFLILSITYVLYTLLYEDLKLPPWIIVVFSLFYLLILLFTGGQTAFIALLFVFSFFILKYLLRQAGPFGRVNLFLVLGMLITILVFTYLELPAYKNDLSDSWDRFDLWRSGILANTDFIWGVGTGDYRLILDNYYRLNDKIVFAQNSLNSHNQFIQIYFSNGLLGLMAVCLLIFRPIYLAFKNNDQLAILMIFPFLIYGMTEVFLGRYQGVVIFALLHQIFTSFYLNVTADEKLSLSK